MRNSANEIEQRSLFSDIDSHLINDSSPSLYLNQINMPAFYQYPFTMLSGLKNVPQSPMHHPEGNVWNHTMLTLDVAAEKKRKALNSRSFIWAALLHDIGKAKTTKSHRGKITAYDHDKIGASMANEFLSFFTDDNTSISEVTALVRWHMQILFVTKKLPFANVREMMTQVDAQDIALLGLCDRLGRLGVNKQLEHETIQSFLQSITN